MRSPDDRRSIRSFRATLLLAALIPAVAWSAPAIHTVTSLTDTGAPGELRALMNAAAPGDTIVIPPGTIVLSGAANDDANASGDLDVTKDLTIVGAGAELTVIDGAGGDRVFHVLAGVTASISGLTMRDGFIDPFDPTIFDPSGGGLLTRGNVTLADVIVEDSTAQGGGGIANFGGVVSISGSTIRNNFSTGTTANGGGISNFGDMTIDSSTISGNSISPPGGSTSGAGIINVDTMSITNSTISGNATDSGLGAGIYQTPFAVSLRLVNVTVANNKTALNDGGGLVSAGGKVVMANTILTDNEDGRRTAGRDCFGNIDSLGYNLIYRSACALAGVTTGNILGRSGKLYPLDDNGGPTRTHALRNSSRAIDGGGAALCPGQDQRGVARITICDIGAIEQR